LRKWAFRESVKTHLWAKLFFSLPFGKGVRGILDKMLSNDRKVQGILTAVQERHDGG
jgi:hypothetical protein